MCKHRKKCATWSWYLEADRGGNDAQLLKKCSTSILLQGVTKKMDPPP